jgi:hypothetical protein
MTDRDDAVKSSSKMTTDVAARYSRLGLRGVLAAMLEETIDEIGTDGPDGVWTLSLSHRPVVPDPAEPPYP